MNKKEIVKVVFARKPDWIVQFGSLFFVVIGASAIILSFQTLGVLSWIEYFSGFGSVCFGVFSFLENRNKTKRIIYKQK